MFYSGLFIGLFAFAVTGLFQPLVVKCEYHFSWRVWPVFLGLGLLFLLIALLTEPIGISALFGILGFACLRCILELRQQAGRVSKGWFPANPNRKEPS